MVYLESPSTDAYFNLALEQYVFDRLPRDKAYFMLWQNDNAVIVGKYQNTAREINAAFVRERGIKVVRRLSGGGAVYHDLGNLNFTIIVDAAEEGKLDLAYFTAPLVAALKHFNVDAQATGRNDITIDGAKFSGNAQYVKNGRVMHHGTILYDSDISVVSAALSPQEDKFQDKSVRSVRSRVTNLRPYLGGATLADLKAAFAAEMARGGGTALENHPFTDEDIAAAQQISRERYASWDWNYGQSPAYQREKRRRIPEVGTIEAHLSSEDGRITAFKTYGDYFGEGDTPDLLERILGAPLEEGALLNAIRGLDVGRFYHNMTGEAFVRLLVE
ncbi:MAG: lipoate--protein ligase [Spirochaetaceae bacterium]|jgi:lipoate-protein ligase A|nr:lipoate--protein ligase [Spirochaetaceae bacterium]